jgi:hypothetical protein
MRTGPYHRHSVWLDVLGVLLVGAVLVGGAGYLLYQAGGGAMGTGGGTVGASASPSSTPAAQGPPARRSRPPIAGRSPLASGAPSGRRLGATGEAAAPFSKSWRQRATPDLTGPTSGGEKQGSAGGGAPASSGPAIASSRSSGESGWIRTGGGTDVGWRAEARRLANRSRALSRQLGQMAQDRNSETAKKDASSRAEGNASTAGARTNDREVPPPPGVPLGGAEWLAAAGAAYALNRLRRDGSDDEGEPSEA